VEKYDFAPWGWYDIFIKEISEETPCVK